MPSSSRIIICAAGGGKTTRLVEDALADKASRAALVTYTRNNEAEIRRKAYEHGPSIPSRIEVMTWFTFLLREMARPYAPAVHSTRIDGFHWVEGRSARFVPESDVSGHYFADGHLIYSDKISKFICLSDDATRGAVLARLKARYDHIMVDEIQDMAGYDLDVLERILRAGIKVTLVGDHRQSTFRTNHSKRNEAYSGIKIIGKFREWHEANLAVLSYEDVTHRCQQSIADLGDAFFPSEPLTKSRNGEKTGHDGVFIVPSNHVAGYVREFSPQVLRLHNRTDCYGLPAMNFGESKGLTFDRVLIFPHTLGQKWLATGNFKHVKNSAAKMYVGVTRARHSVAFVFDGEAKIPGAKIYAEPKAI